MNPSGPRAFCFGNLLITNSIYIIDIGLLRCAFSPCVCFEYCIFQKIGPVHLGYQICGWGVDHNISLLSFLMPRGLNEVPFSLLIIVFCVFSIFYLVNLARGLSILLVISKNWLLVSLILSIDFLFSIL